MRVHGVLAATLVLSLAGCRSVYTEYDPRTDFSGYRSVNWLRLDEGCDTDESRAMPRIMNYVRTGLVTKLQDRGLAEAGRDDADLLACVQIEMGDFAGAASANSEVRPQKVGGVTIASLSDSWMPDDEKAVILDRGTLVLKLWDRKRDVLVWQGWVQRIIGVDDVLLAEAHAEESDGVIPPHLRKILDRAVSGLVNELPSGL